MRVSLYLRSMKTIEDFADIGRQGGQDFGRVASHAHQSDRGFGIGAGLCGEDEIDGVDLSFPS